MIGKSAHRQKCKHYRPDEGVEEDEELEDATELDDDNDSGYESD